MDKTKAHIFLESPSQVIDKLALVASISESIVLFKVHTDCDPKATISNVIKTCFAAATEDIIRSDILWCSIFLYTTALGPRCSGGTGLVSAFHLV